MSLLTFPSLMQLSRHQRQRKKTKGPPREKRKAVHPEKGGDQADYDALKAQELELKDSSSTILLRRSMSSRSRIWAWVNQYRSMYLTRSLLRLLTHTDCVTAARRDN